MQMRLEAWQLADGLFSPHYESDQYTSTELRRIADELDRRAKAPGKIPRGRPGEP
jgi:hypothetical protein